MSKFGEKVKSMLRNWLQIQPAAQNSIVLQEPLSHQASVIRNQIWYRGEAAELEQLYSSSAHRTARTQRGFGQQFQATT